VSDFVRLRGRDARDRRFLSENETIVTDARRITNRAFASDARRIRRATSLRARKSVKFEDRLKLVFDSEAS
jgi:hypothetical protein